MGTATSLDARLGSFRHRCWQGLLRNSAQFPMANLLLEVLLEGWRILLAPAVYVLQAPLATGPRRELMVKGKQAPIEVLPLLGT